MLTVGRPEDRTRVSASEIAHGIGQGADVDHVVNGSGDCSRGRRWRSLFLEQAAADRAEAQGRRRRAESSAARLSLSLVAAAKRKEGDHKPVVPISYTMVKVR